VNSQYILLFSKEKKRGRIRWQGGSSLAPGGLRPPGPLEIRPSMFSKARRALPFGSRLSNESKGLKDCECDLLQEMAAHDHHHAERRLDGPKSSTETIGTAKHVEHTEVPPITGYQPYCLPETTKKLIPDQIVQVDGETAGSAGTRPRPLSTSHESQLDLSSLLSGEMSEPISPLEKRADETADSCAPTVTWRKRSYCKRLPRPQQRPGPEPPLPRHRPCWKGRDCSRYSWRRESEPQKATPPLPLRHGQQGAPQQRDPGWEQRVLASPLGLWKSTGGD